MRGAARNGEQVEAYVVRSRETEVEVFGGEVESLTTAVIEGIGVRVIADHRQGYAWAGSLDADVVDETLRDARDNAAFGEPDEWYALARRPTSNGVGAHRRSISGATSSSRCRPTRRSRIALELDRATKAADPRIRNVESAGYGDALAEAAIANSLGVEAASGARRARASAARSPTTAPARRPATASSPAARSPISTSIGAARRRRRVRVACSARKPIAGPSHPGDPRSARDAFGARRVVERVQRRVGVEGSFAVRRAGRRADRRAVVTVLDDPTDPRVARRRAYDSEGVPTRPTTLIADGVLQGFLQNVYTGRRPARARPAARSRGYTSTPGVGARALRLEPGTHSPEEIMASVPEALYVQSVSGLHSGTNPISGDFSVGAEGLMVRGGAFAEPVREVTIASTLQRMLLDIADIGADLTFLPGAVAGMTVLISEMTSSGSR